MSTNENGVKLPYGVATDGRLLHISEVPSGLACACCCTSCGERLVARKGERKADHFAHHVSRACVAAWETTLHLLAKEVVSEVREIMLPKAVAVLGDQQMSVAGAGAFTYDAVALEVDLGGLRPDAVLRKGDRELLVEFAVHHFCDGDKRAELRRRNLPTVEIDLSDVPRHASRAEHAGQILRTAPRYWLHNSRIAAAQAELQTVAERREADERKRRQWQYGRIAREVAAAWMSPAQTGHPSWRQYAHDIGHGYQVGVSVPGMECFAVAPATWQTALLRFAFESLGGQQFSADGALRHLQRLGMLKEPFKLRRNWEPELVACLLEELPGFRVPQDVLSAYADHLAGIHLLVRTTRGWRADQDQIFEAGRRKEAAQAARERLSRLTEKLGAILASVSSPEAVAARWMERDLPDADLSPRKVALFGGVRFDALMRRLDELGRMVPPGGAPADGDLLGLPLEPLRRLRTDEAKARAEEWRRREEDRRRKEASDFVDMLTAQAVKAFGRSRAVGWMEEAFQAAVGTSPDEGRFQVDRAAMRKLEQALAAECDRVARERADEQARIQREERAAELAAVSRRSLEREVASRIPDPDRASLWLRATHPALGRSPLAHCTGKPQLVDCLRVLDGSLSGRGRRR